SFPYASADNRLQHSFREVGAYLFDVGEVDRDLPGLLASLDPQSVDRLVVDEGHDERVEPSAGDVDPVGLPPDGEQHFLHEVLRGDIARGTGRVGAAAETADGAIELRGARLHSGDYVRQGHAARIVEVEAQRRIGKSLEEQGHDFGDLARVGDADRVAEGDGFGAGIPQALGNLHHASDIDLGLVWAAKRS